MARNSIPTMKLVGIVLIVCGAGLIYWAHQLSGSLSSQLTETISGSMPDEIMYRYIGGAALLAVGLYSFFRR